MKRIDFQRVLEGVDRLGKLLGLHVGRAEEIPGVGIVGVDFGDVIEGVDRGLGSPVFFASRPRLYQAYGILRILLLGFFQRGFGFVDFLQI